MVEVAELIRRLEVLEREGSVAALARLEKRFGELEQKQEGHSTALVKIIELLEETRLRVSKVERVQDDHTARLDRIETDIKGLRRDMPGIVAEAMRDVLKENPTND